MNETIVDKTHKENIHYINEVAFFKAPSDNSNITLNDLYDFVRDDLILASYTSKKESCSDDSSFPFDFLEEEIIENTVFQKEKIELGFLGQDLEDSNNKIKNLIANIDDARQRNDAIKCNEINYINVLAGALKQAINKIEMLEEKLNNQ